MPAYAGMTILALSQTKVLPNGTSAAEQRPQRVAVRAAAKGKAAREGRATRRGGARRSPGGGVGFAPPRRLLRRSWWGHGRPSAPAPVSSNSPSCWRHRGRNCEGAARCGGSGRAGCDAHREPRRRKPSTPAHAASTVAVAAPEVEPDHSCQRRPARPASPSSAASSIFRAPIAARGRLRCSTGSRRDATTARAAATSSS